MTDRELRDRVISLADDYTLSDDDVRAGLNRLRRELGPKPPAPIQMEFWMGDQQFVVPVSVVHDPGSRDRPASLNGTVWLSRSDHVPEIEVVSRLLRRRFRLESWSLGFNAVVTAFHSDRIDYTSTGLPDVRLPWTVVDGRAVPPSVDEAIAAMKPAP